MNDTIEASSALDEGKRVYSVDAVTRRLNWLLVGRAVAFSVGIGCLGTFSTSSNSIRILAGLLIVGLLVFAIYAARYNQLATFLYPDRVVSRGLFTQASLQRDDIAGYELIPERSGPPTLKLTPKNPARQPLRINRFTPDDAFQRWLSDLPDLRLTPPVLRRKERLNIIVVGIFSIGWCVLLALGLRQTFTQYDGFMVLKSRGVAADGLVQHKSISGRSHTHYVAYTFQSKTYSHPGVFDKAVEIDASDYESVVDGNRIPVVYDPRNPNISYPNPNELLHRISPHAYLRHAILFWGFMTVFILVIMGLAYVADLRFARRPLPLGGSV